MAMVPLQAKRENVGQDVMAFFGNISSSVLLIYSNKVLMSSKNGYNFRFGECLII